MKKGVDNNLNRYRIGNMIRLISLIIGLVLIGQDPAWAYTDAQIVDAIYIAEGGRATKHPYGILKKFKTTTPRQACFNTVRRLRGTWNGKGDLIAHIGKTYCPVGAANDPRGLNKNWVPNVNAILAKC